MRKRTILTLIVVMMLLMASILVLASCGTDDDKDEDSNTIVEHHFGQWDLVSLPTATKEGSLRRICTDDGCEMVETFVLPVISDYNYKSDIIIAPTCTEEGKIKYTLISDEVEYSFEQIMPANGHQFIIKSDGTNHIEECKVCGYNKNEHKAEFNDNSNKCTKCDYAYGDCFEFTKLDDGNYAVSSYDRANYPNITDVSIPNEYNGKRVTKIGRYAFNRCEQLLNIVIPDSIDTIDDYAFISCRGLANINIPNSVTAIEEYAFSNCSGLTDMVIPNSITTIKNSTFFFCTGLESVTIPDSVTTINDTAFLGCSKLTNITIPSSVTSIGNGVFANCSSLEGFTIDPHHPKYRVEGNCIIDRDTMAVISGCKNSIIPNGVTSIANDAFVGCDRLTNIVIPSSVQSIGEHVFAYCSGLSSIVVPDGVEYIRGYTFTECTSLTSVTLPSSLVSIGEYAFSECTSLTSITIPNSVTALDIYAFNNCSSLISVIIPDSVTFIGGATFAGCNLLTIYAEANVKPDKWNIDNGKIVWGYEDTVDHTYSFETNGGSAVADITAKGIITLPTPTKEGYTFAGWYDNVECTGTAVSIEYWNKNGAKLYAKWVANA